MLSSKAIGHEAIGQETEGRPWLRLRLPAKEDALNALSTVNMWKETRSAAPNIIKAIRLFYELSQGKTDLLWEFFPHLANTLSTHRPVSTTIVPRRPTTPMDVVVIEKSDEENEDDFAASLGLDELEF